jgi:hypothetical protein
MSRSLLDKLGFRAGATGWVVGAPADLDVAFAGVVAGDDPAWIAAFCRNAATVQKVAREVLPLYRPGGHLWLIYPKRGGGIETDINRDHGWGPIEAAGFLPVAQVAVNVTWSALRFRRREEIPRITRKGG